MNIGIVGAGNIGGTLAQRFTDLGHHVAVANSLRSGDPRCSRGPERSNAGVGQ